MVSVATENAVRKTENSRYDLLINKAENNAKERQYADLCNELEGMRAQMAHLERVREKNQDKLEYCIWKSKDGKYRAICDLSDEHLANILLVDGKKFLVMDEELRYNLNEEAKRRGLGSTKPLELLEECFI